MITGKGSRFMAAAWASWRTFVATDIRAVADSKLEAERKANNQSAFEGQGAVLAILQRMHASKYENSYVQLCFFAWVRDAISCQRRRQVLKITCISYKRRVHDVCLRSLAGVATVSTALRKREEVLKGQ